MSPLILKRGRERSLLKRHPWVFSGAIHQHPQAQSGDIVPVNDGSGKTLAWGFYDSRSQITCRLFAFGDELTAPPSPLFWQTRVSNAHRLRQALQLTQPDAAYRLLHAEGDFLPGVIADAYGDTLVLQILIQGTEKLLPHLLESFTTLGFRHIYLKSKASSRHLEDVRTPEGWLQGGHDQPLRVAEHGLLYEVQPAQAQKTGLFLDQRDNRLLLRRYASAQRVLDTFCYVGGFSMNALAAGATRVVSVDQSQTALDQCAHHVHLNFPQLPQAQHSGVCADCFRYLRETPETFDTIVLDPPAFAKKASAVEAAARGYKDLNLVALRRIAAGGTLLTFSCSQHIDTKLFRQIAFAAAADARRNIRILHTLTQPPDHPINIYHPEGEYLKGLVLHVE